MCGAAAAEGAGGDAVQFLGLGPWGQAPERGHQPSLAGSLLLKFILHFKLQEFSVFPFSKHLLLGNRLSSGLSQLSLALAEQKCQEWKSQYETLKEDWRTLGDQHRELESQLHVLQSKLQVPGPGRGRRRGRREKGGPLRKGSPGLGQKGWTHVTSSFQVFIHCPLVPHSLFGSES